MPRPGATWSPSRSDPTTPSEKLRQGYQVFAFEEARSTLEKLGYQFEPVRLFDVPLPQYLDVIAERRIVALAATPDVAAQLRENRRGWARLGVSHTTVFGQKIGAPIAIVGVIGAGAATESIGFPRASVTIPPEARSDVPGRLPASRSRHRPTGSRRSSRSTASNGPGRAAGWRWWSWIQAVESKPTRSRDPATCASHSMTGSCRCSG